MHRQGYKIIFIFSLDIFERNLTDMSNRSSDFYFVERKQNSLNMIS